MSPKILCSALRALAFVVLSACVARAAIVNSNIPVSGPFSATLSGSGSASLTSASGQYWQWVGVIFGTPTWTKLNVSAPVQTVGLNVPTVNATNLPASGNVDLDYDNVTPGTPLNINAFNGDLNGAGGSNTNIPLTITSSPLNINIQNLGSFQLALTINALVTDLKFNSTGGSPVDGSGLYIVPGDFTGAYQATVTGSLVNVPLLGTIPLGTLTTIPSTPIAFTGAGIPGVASLSDLDGGLPPFPNDMQADFAAAFLLTIPIPLSGPIAVAQNNTLSNGQSGFRTLNINGSISATLNLSNPSYSLSGVEPQVLIPEPSSLALSGLALAGLAAVIVRRRVNG